MKTSRKTLGGVLIAVVTLLVLMLCFSLTPSAAESATSSGDNTINVWLIGGQSNAVGYGQGAPADAATDSRYYTGFDNVIYYGNHEQWKYNEDDFVPTTIGLGRTADNDDKRVNTSGAEIGIAKALADTGEMNAIIKFAYGGTYLYPKQSASINDNAKTWTSPTYLEKYPAMNTGANIGALYSVFKQTLTEGIALLRAEGYTPVIKGMWWMQGENEGMNETYASAYQELLECLVKDIRDDVAEIVGDSTLNTTNPMPFVCGNVMRNPNDATQYPALATVNAAQAAVAKKIQNVAVLTKENYSSQSSFGYLDGWHFNVDTYNYMGKKFVEMALDIHKQNIISVKGEGIEVSGAGIKGESASATVKITAKPGYTITGVTKAGANLGTSGTYSVTMSGSDVALNVSTTYSESASTTAYGTISAQYNNPEKYPFALFKNGNFVGAYEYYGAALAVVPKANGSDNYTLLLREDYATVPADYTTAPTSFGGSFTLDLGGKTMVRGNRAYVLEVYSNDNSTYATSLTVKNGSMYSSGDFSLVGLNYSTLSNVSKVYNLTFDAVNFSTNVSGRGTPVVINAIDASCYKNDSASTTDGAGLTTNVTFSGCTFDFGETSGNMMCLSTNGIAKTVATVKINGGSIVSKTASYSLYSATAEDKVTIGALGGNYPTVTLPTSVTPPSYTYTTDNGKIYGIDAASGTVNGSNTVYAMGEQTLNTKYGEIGEEYKESGTYKFALFKVNSSSNTGYSFVKGYATFAEVCNAAGLKGSPLESGTDYVILLRTSFTNTEGVNNMQNFKNNVTIDLGGNTVTLTTQHFLPLYYTPSAATEFGKITIKNGTIVNNSASNNTISAIRADSGSLSHNLTYNVDVENVTFKVASSSKSLNGAFSASGNNGTANLIANVNFKDCTFDYTNAPASTVMINANATLRKANVSVVGGNIIAPTGAFSFAATDSGDTLDFKANSTGASMALKLPKGAAAPTTKIGALEFVYSKTQGGYDVYNLVEKNAYGDIPAQYIDSDAYPVLLFKADKTFVRGYAHFADAAIAAGLVNGGANSQVAGADAVILFRRDYAHVGESGNMNGYYNNVTIDLGGYTVQIGTDSIKKNFLVLYPNASYANEKATFGTITVKNGTFKNMWDNTAAICFNGGGSVSNNIVYTVNYENVRFTVRNHTNTIYGAIRTWGGAAKNITLNATYNDCYFDYTGANTNAGMFGLSYNSNTTTVFNIKINGGGIIAGSNNAFNFIEADASDIVTLSKNSEGNYPTLSLAAGTAAPTGKYNADSMRYTYSGTANGYDNYTLISNSAKEYNLTIALSNSSMTDMAKYALTVYVNGSVVSLPYTATYAEGTTVKILAKGAGNKNYSVTINGAAAEELNMTMSDNTSISIGITELTNVTKIPVSSVTSSHASANDTSWDETKLIDGIRVTGGSSNGYSTQALGTQTLSKPVEITFNLGSVKTINQIAIFPRSDKASVNAALSANYPVDFTISVSTNNTDYQTVLTVTGETSPLFPKQYCYSFDDAQAQYVKITITKVGNLVSDEANSTRFRVQLAEVEIYYNENLATGGDTTEADKTLNITTDNADMAKYALSVYVDGSLVSLPYTKALAYGTKVKIVAKGAGQYNYAVTINGVAVESLDVTLTADTNVVIGITELSTVTKKPISNVTASDVLSNNTAWAPNNLKDGKRVSNSAPYGYSSNWKSNQGRAEGEIVLTFDLGSVQTINQIALFPRSDSWARGDSTLSCNYPTDFTISVSKDGSNYTTVVVVKNGDNPRFKQQCYSFADVDARYVKLEVTKLGLAAYNDGNSNQYRLQLAEVEIYYNSKLTERDTEYGTIREDYINVDTYPIVVFKTDKTFVAGFTTYKAAQDATIGKSEDYIILFRRDYANSDTKMIGAFYNNVTIDLGGHTVETRHHFLALYGTGTPSNTKFGTINVKNGTITVKDSLNNTIAPVRLDGNWSTQVTYTVNLENVKFTVDSGSQSSFGAVSTANAAGTANVLNVTLTDCIFDFANSKSGTVMISASTNRIVNATIYGGKILAGSNNAFTLVNKDSADKVIFAKNDSGDYIELVLNAGTSAPSTNTVYTTENGVECVFVKLADTTYTLYPKVMVGYTVKTSVTLYSNFVYNIYIPKANVKSFTINGKTVAYTTEIINNVEYYRVEVNLPAPETLNDIKVKVTLNSGSTTVDANWTLNVLSYAKSVLADTKTDNVTKAAKTLVKDMLVYAKAAHTYFKNTADVAAKLSEIATVLNGYNASVPTGTAMKPTDKTYFTDVAVYVGDVPSFRFYLASGYTAANFTFTVGGNAVQVKEENGYVEIAMYAYRMLDDVTFTVKGKNVTESYNLYSYYEFAKTQNNADLTAIVEGLMKYSASAKAYKAAYMAANPNA